MARRWLLTLTLGLWGCGEPTSPPDGGWRIPTPPGVFLTVDGPNVIGTAVTGRVNVTGCQTIRSLVIRQGTSPLKDVTAARSPVQFQLEPGLFPWGTLGFAASLSLNARVECDDGRTSTSSSVGATFFPVTSRFSSAAGQALPDSFIAEGGLGGTPVTFVGCVGTTTGTALGRADTKGQVIALNDRLPFPCSARTVISERSAATGTRWVLEPGVGAYAINSSLDIVKIVSRKIEGMGVAADGTAILWDTTLNRTALLKAVPAPTTDGEWAQPFVGFMNSTPVIDTGSRVVSASAWQMTIGSGIGDVVIYRFNLDTGQPINFVGSPPGPPVLVRQTFSQLNTPIMPGGAFSPDGQLFYVPLLSDAMGVIRTTVLACATGASGCENAGRRWASRTFDGVVNLIVPFDGYLAAVGPYQTWFLDTAGVVKNLQETPIRPGPSLQFLGVQPGPGGAMYFLAGPVFAENVPAYPTEIIAVDRPESGEVYRFTHGSGERPAMGMYLALDDTGQAWFRVGVDQVKPEPLSQYRMVRGPTVIR